MNFLWQPGYTYSYSDIKVVKMASKKRVKQMVARAAADGKYPAILVNTHVSGHFFFKKFFPLLDCDSWGDMLAAKHWLKTHFGLESIEIESSPERFWVIADKVMGLKEAQNIVMTTPGVDENYKTFVRYFRRGSKSIVVRACPKENGHIPDFRRIGNLTEPLILKWAQDLQHWFEHELLDARRAVTLAQSLKDGTFQEHLADPSFVV